MVARRLYQTAAEQIAALIDSGQFAPGTRLPGERDLSQRLGVSRVTIREAEIALQATGRLQIRTGAGVYVSDTPVDPPGFADLDPLEVLEARLVIESETAALAAVRIDEEALDRVETLVEAMETATRYEDEAIGELHSALASASGNAALAGAVAGLWLQQSALAESGGLPRAEIGEEGLRRYRELLPGLHRRDASAVRQAMRRCIEGQIGEFIELEESRSLSEVQERIDATRQRFSSSRANRTVKLVL